MYRRLLRITLFILTACGAHMASAATFVIDDTGPSMVAIATGVNSVSYNFGISGSSAAASSFSFDKNTVLFFSVSYRDTTFTRVPARSVLFLDSSGAYKGFLQYGVSNNSGFASLSGNYRNLTAGPVDLPAVYETAVYGGSYDLPGLTPAQNMAASIKLAAADGSAMPEPASWALMVLGFGAVGATLRSHVPGRQARQQQAASCYPRGASFRRQTSSASIVANGTHATSGTPARAARASTCRAAMT